MGVSMSKLLRRAKTKLNNANNSFQKIAEDDAYADDCCYNLQQCIEFTLKYLIEINGSRYVENHDIRAQLNLLKKISVSVPMEKDLRLFAATLNSWEDEARHNDDFVSSEEEMQDAFSIANALVSFADTAVTQKKLEKMDSFPSERLK